MHPNDRIPRRCEILASAYKVFAKEIGVNDSEVYLCEYSLTESVVNYFYELDSFKEKHGFLRADPHKIAAFTFRWLAKTKPIQIKDGADADFELLVINEMFAIWAAINFLKIDNLSNAPMVTIVDLLNIASRSDYHAEMGGIIFFLIEQQAKFAA